MSEYSRVVLKLSGEALAGASGWGVEPSSLAHLADEVLRVHELGLEVAVVVGGGNYFRGRMAQGWGIGRAEADNIEMLGTVMNALMLRGALTARTDADVRVMTAIPIHSVAEPYIRLRAMSHLGHGAIVLLAGGIGQPYVTTDYPAVQRALEVDADALLVAKRGVDGVYERDPNVDPEAVRFTTLTYDEALTRGVRVMDTNAFVLANEHNLVMHVFDVAANGAMRAICRGDEIGTRISKETSADRAIGRSGPLSRIWPETVHSTVAGRDHHGPRDRFGSVQSVGARLRRQGRGCPHALNEGYEPPFHSATPPG